MSAVDKPISARRVDLGARESSLALREVREAAFQVVALTVLSVLGIASLVPLYWMFSTSIKFQDVIFQMPPQWIPYPISFAAWVRLFTFDLTLRWFLNTFIVASVVTVGHLIFNTMAGYSLSKLQFPGRQAYFWVIMATFMIPGQVILIPQYALMVELNWLDTYQGLIAPALGGAFGIFLMRQYLQTLPSTLVDAARMDACSEVGIFWQVIVPLAKPAMAVLAIFTFMGQWNSFLWPLLIGRSPEMLMIQPGLTALRAGALDYGMLMAGASAAAIPMILVFLFFQRYFMIGLTLGAVKG